MDLVYFKQWVYRKFGIDLTAYKENQLHRRLLSLMSRVGVNSVDEYISLLEKDASQRQKFLDFITINVTEFFRNPEIFYELENVIKNNLLQNKNSLKIWSAACSIGAEPYSVAMLLDDIIPYGNNKIIATDIDETILKRAKAGKYVYSEVKNVKNDFMQKYFKIENDSYFICDKIKRMVDFKKQDLILDEYEKNFDLILCRNVVIYFNQDVKDKIYQKFSNSLNQGGLLFVGATESIFNYRNFGFEKASTFIYRKL